MSLDNSLNGSEEEKPRVRILFSACTRPATLQFSIQRIVWGDVPVSRLFSLCSLFWLLIFLTPAVAWSLPDEISQVGFVVTENGEPYRDQHSLLVQFFETSERGQPFYEERHRQVEFYEGHYAIAIGSIVPLNPLDFLRDDIFVQITINDQQVVEPRIPLFKVPAAMVSDLALNVRGEITPSSVRIGDQLVIDENGRWVGDPTGLQGPAGPPGDVGPQGPQGPRGPAGASGNNADPAEVVPLVIADIIASPPENMPFLRKDTDDVTTGNLTLDGGTLDFGGGCCRAVLNLRNNRMIGIDSLRFNDPGPNEGIAWQGSQAAIYVAPANDENAMELRLVNDDGVRIATWATVDESLGIGTDAPRARLDVRGGIQLANTEVCAPERSGTLRWTGDALQVCTGERWQGFLAAGANLADLIQDQDGDGSGVDADRIDGVDSSQFMRGDGNTGTTGRLGVGTRDPQHPLHVVGTGKHVFENSSDEGTTSGIDLVGQPGNVTMGRVEAGKEANFGAVAGRDSYLALSTSQDGVTGEKYGSTAPAGWGLAPTRPAQLWMWLAWCVLESSATKRAPIVRTFQNQARLGSAFKTVCTTARGMWVSTSSNPKKDSISMVTH